MRTPEYEKALEAWKEKEMEWEDFLETLSAEQREKAEEIKECQDDFTSAQELRAYIHNVINLRKSAHILCWNILNNS